MTTSVAKMNLINQPHYLINSFNEVMRLILYGVPSATEVVLFGELGKNKGKVTTNAECFTSFYRVDCSSTECSAPFAASESSYAQCSITFAPSAPRMAATVVETLRAASLQAATTTPRRDATPLPVTRYRLLVTRYLLPVTGYWLLVTRYYSLVTTHIFFN